MEQGLPESELGIKSLEVRQMRIGRINPSNLTEQELSRLLKHQKVRSQRFGTIQIPTEQEMDEFVSKHGATPPIDPKYAHFIRVKMVG